MFTDGGRSRYKLAGDQNEKNEGENGWEPPLARNRASGYLLFV